LQGQSMQTHADVKGSHQFCHHPVSAANCLHMLCIVSHVLGAGCVSKE